MLCERWLPYGDLLLVCGRAAARRVAECRVSSRQIRAVVVKRVQVFLVSESENEVEVAPSFRRRAVDELEVARREHHGGKRAERVTEPANFIAVDRNFLAFGVAIEADGDLAPLWSVRLRGDVESRRVEARQVLIARSE